MNRPTSPNGPRQTPAANFKPSGINLSELDASFPVFENKSYEDASTESPAPARNHQEQKPSDKMNGDPAALEKHEVALGFPQKSELLNSNSDPVTPEVVTDHTIPAEEPLPKPTKTQKKMRYTAVDKIKNQLQYIIKIKNTGTHDASELYLGIVEVIEKAIIGLVRHGIPYNTHKKSENSEEDAKKFYKRAASYMLSHISEDLRKELRPILTQRENKDLKFTMFDPWSSYSYSEILTHPDNLLILSCLANAAAEVQ